MPRHDESPEPEAATLLRQPSGARTISTAETIARVPRPRRFDDLSGRGPAKLSVDVSGGALAAPGSGQRYEARSVLGVGGMGEVRLCKDRLIGREVAFKVMRRETCSTDDARERFLREARVQGQLEHPAIVPVYDLGVDPEGGVFFTMKRVRGRTLDAVIDALAAGVPEAARKYSRRKLLTAWSQVCLAVDFAHARGVLHRDLKPSNIILGDFGEVYVLDWGLAKLAGASEDAVNEIVLPHDGTAPTMVGSLIGTPGYMAPEQARGDNQRVDVYADVYALGAILFEILALEPLHPLRSMEAALASTLKGADARPSARTMGEYPPELEAICVRATALDPAARYGGARALSNAVEQFLDGDRNVELRKDMAAAHVEAAKKALVRAEAGGAAATPARTEALREVGSALALDPRNVEALSTMARLLTEVPSEVPAEAEAEHSASTIAKWRQAAKSGTGRYLVWSAMLPFALWMGIRDWLMAAAVILFMVLSGGFALWLSRRRRIRLSQGVSLLVLSSIAIVFMSAPFGPFILVPGIAAANTMFFAMSADRRGRGVVILLGVLAVTIPYALQAAGVVPPAYTFTGGIMHMMPRVTELPAFQTTLCLLATNVAMVVSPGLMVGSMRDALAAAERRLFLQAWHLRQLVPHEAQGALAPAPSSRVGKRR